MIFNEIYGTYYNMLARLLSQAVEGELTEERLYATVQQEGYEESVLTVPKEAAYEVAMEMVGAGVRGVWNFANMELKLPTPEVIVENIHLGDSLMTLCYAIKSRNSEGEENV